MWTEISHDRVDGHLKMASWMHVEDLFSPFKLLESEQSPVLEFYIRRSNLKSVR